MRQQARVEVDSGVLQITWGGRTIATQHLVAWDRPGSVLAA